MNKYLKRFIVLLIGIWVIPGGLISFGGLVAMLTEEGRATAWMWFVPAISIVVANAMAGDEIMEWIFKKEDDASKK